VRRTLRCDGALLEVETESTTPAVRRDALRKATRRAVRRNTSPSRLLTETLEVLVAREDRDEAARRKHLATREHGCARGSATRRRNDLHER
jgi:hypothetical protein